MRHLRTSYGYDTYRGRTALQRVLSVIIVLLLIVLLLAVAAFFFLQRYIVYTDDGQARLELPFLQSSAAAATPLPTQAHPMVLVTPEPVATPQPTAAPAAAAIHPVSLFRAAFTEGNTQRLVTGAGGDAALFNMRSNDGSLGYVSALPLSVLAKTSAADVKLEGQIHAVTDTELYTIARVSCFKDNLLPRTDPSLALKTVSGYNWRDGSDTRWLDPANAQAQQYAAGVCGELAALGFDEIVLDHAGYPTTGNLAQIQGGVPDAAAQAQTLEGFYQSVREAIGDDVALAIAVNAQALEGDGDGSGVTAELLGQYAQRVYILGCDTPGACDQALAQQGLTGGAVVYVDAKCDDLSPTGRAVSQ